MNKIKQTIIVLIAVFSFCGYAAAQDIELFISAKDTCLSRGADAQAKLYKVNPETAESTLRGVIEFDGVTALEFLPNGKLLGTANNDNNDMGIDISALISINPSNGQSSLIGEISNSLTGCGRAPGLTYDTSSNRLYSTGDACDIGDDYLILVNPNNGQGDMIGTYSPFDGGGNGIAANSDGVLFVTAEESLITVDPETAAPTYIADIQITVENSGNVFVNALAFHPITGELYGTTIGQNSSDNPRSSKLILLNTETGATEIIGDLPECTDGLAFTKPPRVVPTLSEWGLIAMAGLIGIIGIIAVRRKKAAV